MIVRRMLFLAAAGWALSTFVARSAESHTRASLVADLATLAPGDSFDVGIRLEMEPGGHTYWKDPGDSGLATSVSWELPKGFVAAPLRWPKPKVFKEGGLVAYGYENEVVLLARITAPREGLSMGRTIVLRAKVEWLECKESCVPGSAALSRTLRVGATSVAGDPQERALLDRFRRQVPSDDWAPDRENGAKGAEGRGAVSPERRTSNAGFFSLLGAAFLGGLILNVMPCVLPVIAIKILGFVRQGDGTNGARRLGAWFVLGVLVSFWALALVVIGLQAAGREIGWGFQFQEPRFLLAMALVTTAVALSFFGVFEMGAGGGAIQAAGTLAAREGSAGAFFNGVLATVLATPCTAPFLSTAMFYALSRPAGEGLLFFTAAGAGLAAPYALLAARPSLLKFLPKPGAWMARFKQFMGFPMLATSLWLAWTLGAAYGNDAAAVLLAVLLAASLALWALGAWQPRRGWLAVGVVLLAAWLGSGPLMKVLANPKAERAAAVEGIAWRSWSAEAVESVLRETRAPLFVDFTANWCLTCQMNKRTSIEIPAVRAKLREIGAIAFRADYTRRDDAITRALKSFGRSGVPLGVVYPADRARPPIVLPEVLTPSLVLDALSRAADASARPR